jgi:hypothetical protein
MKKSVVAGSGGRVKGEGNLKRKPEAPILGLNFGGITMKLFKSLLLASATGLVAVSGASAADLGAKKPSPVEFVRACYNPLWGTSGGFTIPGTQTCLRITGQARFDYGYAQPFARANSTSGFRGGAIVGFDAITASEIGNVRAFGQIGLLYRSGNQFTGTGSRQGTFVPGVGIGAPVAGGLNNPNLFGSNGGTETVFAGFVQFAGITAGRTASFFDPFFVPEVIGSTFRSAPGNVNLIAYTAALGNGITASVSVEDSTTRRQGVLHNTTTPAGVNVATVNANPGPYSPGTGAGFQQVGLRMPDIVANIRVDQAWGSAMLAGVVREVGVVGRINGNFGAAGLNFSPSSKYGYAVQGALKINLPMIAAGDNFVITGAYGEGALSYVTSNFFGGSTATQGFGGVANYVAGDATFDSSTGSFRLTKAWSVAAGFQHFWTPTLSSTVFGSYAQVDQASSLAGLSNLAYQVRDASYWSAGVNTIWSPVRGLNIAGEVAYVAIDPKGRVLNTNKNDGRSISSDGAFSARLRITRDF